MHSLILFTLLLCPPLAFSYQWQTDDSLQLAEELQRLAEDRWTESKTEEKLAEKINPQIDPQEVPVENIDHYFDQIKTRSAAPRTRETDSN